ncbi:Hypothetical protein KVN_LOCUS117 [uncultured virus]|nr:Hypothetical protein KVN_LOCUS117 [uncultured virus]
MSIYNRTFSPLPNSYWQNGCYTDGHCAQGSICYNGICTYPHDINYGLNVNRNCINNSNCPTGTRCVNGQCRTLGNTNLNYLLGSNYNTINNPYSNYYNTLNPNYGLGKNCISNYDCPGGTNCHAGSCQLTGYNHGRGWPGKGWSGRNWNRRNWY